jgi:hypothetical protein
MLGLARPPEARSAGRCSRHREREQGRDNRGSRGAPKAAEQRGEQIPERRSGARAATPSLGVHGARAGRNARISLARLVHGRLGSDRLVCIFSRAELAS